jgi:hypothetical protein
MLPVEAVAVQPVLVLVAVTVYTPLIAVVTPVRLGFCAVLVKLAGPLQLYVNVPGVADDVKLIVPPEQTTGVDVFAVAVGAGLTVIAGVEPLPTQPVVLLVTVTLYAPAAAVLALVIDGFCTVLLKPLGPLHIYVYVPLGLGVALRLIVPPAHIVGVLVVADTVGLAFTVTDTTVAAEVQPFTVCVTL